MSFSSLVVIKNSYPFNNIFIQIVEDMKPRPLVISILSKLSNVIPTWRIIPCEDIIDKAIKSEEWREEV
jgi:hypothetical protein